MLPYAHQAIEASDIEAVMNVLQSEWLTTGPVVEQFEADLAAYVGARYAVAFSSATAALHGAITAAGVGPGDEGITTPLTFCATANCLLFQGATAVFADVEEDVLTIDPRAVEQRITSKTRVVIPMDYGGHPANLDAIRALAQRHRLVVIEDACHALGAEYRGRRVGALSDMTIFSFHPVKHLTTGEGGMAVTNDQGMAARLRRFRNHGIVRDPTDQARRPWYYEVVELGYNYRLSDIACALGRSQLARLGQNLLRRRAIARRYTEALSDVSGLRLPTIRSEAAPAWHLYPIRLDRALDRDEIFRRLREEQIGVNVHYIPVTLHPYYRRRFGYRGGEHPVAEEASKRLISLPMFHGMTETDVEDVIQAVDKVVRAYAKPS